MQTGRTDQSTIFNSRILQPDIQSEKDANFRNEFPVSVIFDFEPEFPEILVIEHVMWIVTDVSVTL